MSEVAEMDLLHYLTKLTVPEERTRTIEEFSSWLGIDTFIIFLRDTELQTHLPAPGFPQTLPSALRWRAFLKETQERITFHDELPWKKGLVPAHGVAGKDGSILVMLGKEERPNLLEEFRRLLPLLAAALNGERAVAQAVAGKLLAGEIAQRSHDFAKRLDEARHAAQREVAARIKAEEKVQLINETLEQRVEERTQSLSDAVSQLEEITYSVAHDLRAPLRSISSFASILMADFNATLPAEAQDFLRRISTSSNRMLDLTSALLSYTKVDRATFQLGPVSLDETVELAAAQFLLLAPAAKLRIDYPLGVVTGNETLLARCLNNLLDNAAKYARKDEPLSIRIWSEVHGNRRRLLVQDNGVGIDSQYHDRIFKIFERVEIKKPGTGVGLAIVQRAVERMNGKLGVLSKLGEGSIFWMEFPAAEKHF